MTFPRLSFLENRFKTQNLQFFSKKLLAFLEKRKLYSISKCLKKNACKFFAFKNKNEFSNVNILYIFCYSLSVLNQKWNYQWKQTINKIWIYRSQKKLLPAKKIFTCAKTFFFHQNTILIFLGNFADLISNSSLQNNLIMR